jgi:hypothetical protein
MNMSFQMRFSFLIDGVCIMCNDEDLDWCKAYLRIAQDGVENTIGMVEVQGVDLYEPD